MPGRDEQEVQRVSARRRAQLGNRPRRQRETKAPVLFDQEAQEPRQREGFAPVGEVIVFLDPRQDCRVAGKGRVRRAREDVEDGQQVLGAADGIEVERQALGSHRAASSRYRGEPPA